MTGNRRTRTITSILALALIAGVQPAYGEVAVGYRLIATADMDGIRGNQGIRTDPATVGGIGYVHPVQADIGSAGNSFLAIGTYKGNGPDDCADDYDARWTVYVDGELGGTYFCRDVDQDAYGANTNPGFEIVYSNCPGAGLPRWLLKFGGTLESCEQSGAEGAVAVGVGLETTTTSTVDRNIDVVYRQLERRVQNNGNWQNLNPNTVSFDPNYLVSPVSDTRINVYLAPLD